MSSSDLFMLLRLKMMMTIRNLSDPFGGKRCVCVLPFSSHDEISNALTYNATSKPNSTIHYTLVEVGSKSLLSRETTSWSLSFKHAAHISVATKVTR